jgi:hypothetical protein
MRMKSVFARSYWAAAIVVVLVTVYPLHGQSLPIGVKGSVKSSAGSALGSVRISAKNLNTGSVENVQSHSDGSFQLFLSPGDYEISASAPGFGSKTIRLTLPQTAENQLIIELTPTGGLPNAPSASQTAPSLSDLGFPTEQTQSDPRQQALLDKRTHMLRIHQKLGLITAAPMIATLVVSAGAGGKSASTTDRTVHMVLGAVTSDLYFTSAYFAIRAPRVPGTQTRGPIRLHKALAWVHGPGMILTPILGALAYEQKSKGERVHGIASAHGPVAVVTAGAFGAALLAVSVKF